MAKKPKLVEFTASMCDLLPPELRDRLEKELPRVFRVDRHVERILVSRCFGSYSTDFEKRIVLGVEVRSRSRFETHIAKLGRRRDVAPDFRGWKTCTSGRHIASRIFSPVTMGPRLDGGRVAVVYRDAYTLYGLDRERSRPEWLETVVDWAVLDGRPDPLSVERAIAQIFTDLGLWFYPRAKPDRKHAAEFYRARLRFGKEDPVLCLWNGELGRTTLRRDVIWLICGRDRPDADPYTEPAHYLDPVDFVGWMLQPGHVRHLPETLVGRSHGDMHGRNILVGIRRGEIEYPAVFDYGEMGTNNVLAWDFAKLESELKVRLLPKLIGDAAVRAALLRMKPMVPLPAAATSDPDRVPGRAERVAMFLAFEEWLHALSDHVFSRNQAEVLLPLPQQFRTGVARLDRCVAMLLRIRKEAAIWLGFEHQQRGDKWRDELYFALAVHGLLHVRWGYDVTQSECSLVAAGVAAARMPSTPGFLQTCVGAEMAKRRTRSGKAREYPSYRVPLVQIHKAWKEKKYDEGRAIAEQTVLEIKRTGNTEAIFIRPQASHAIPLIAEGALLEVECDRSRLVEPILEQIRIPARTFGDFETLGRLGRLFKDSGDRRWEDSNVDFAQLDGSAAWQMYVKAFAVYEEAFLATQDYYTGINAATLALLTSDHAKAEQYASQVAEICRQTSEWSRADRFWVFATEGEASLILGDTRRAEQFYRDALRELSPGQGGMANSTYKQLCRLWKALGAEVGNALAVFERSEFRSDLTPVLGRTMVKRGRIK